MKVVELLCTGCLQQDSTAMSYHLASVMLSIASMPATSWLGLPALDRLLPLWGSKEA